MSLEKPVVVAEIGINHNGNLGLAKSMIAMAESFGADYVKFQKRNPEVCVPDSEKQSRKMTVFGPMSYIDYKHRMEFGKREFDEIDQYCNKLGIGWFASVWDRDSLDFMVEYDPDFVKIPSACVTDKELLDSCRESGISVVMSTGMSSKDEVDDAVEYLGDSLCYLLHTTSSYPTPNDEMNMSRILTLQMLYGDRCKIGFSNHCVDLIYLVQAVVMNAKMLEFHVTLDRNLPGTDQYASIGPTGFDRLMHHIGNIMVGWGDESLGVCESEIAIRRKLRRVKE